MVKRFHRTLESVICKVINRQEDWHEILSSVLLAVHCQVHCSIGYSPIIMLFNKESVPIFVKADKMTQNSEDVTCNNTDEVLVCLEQIELNWQKIFDLANTNIKKAQVNQCKAYNHHNSIGTKFKVGQKILKINVWDKQHTQKMAPKMLRPYTIVCISETGNLWLKDHFSHKMKKSVHPSQVVEFFKNPRKKTLPESTLDLSCKSDKYSFENLDCQ